MNQTYSRAHAKDAASDSRLGDAPQASHTDVGDRPVERAIDSNAVRWVLAATIAFWLAVYAAGRSFF